MTVSLPNDPLLGAVRALELSGDIKTDAITMHKLKANIC